MSVATSLLYPQRKHVGLVTEPPLLFCYCKTNLCLYHLAAGKDDENDERVTTRLGRLDPPCPFPLGTRPIMLGHREEL